MTAVASIEDASVPTVRVAAAAARQMLRGRAGEAVSAWVDPIAAARDRRAVSPVAATLSAALAQSTATPGGSPSQGVTGDIAWTVFGAAALVPVSGLPPAERPGDRRRLPIRPAVVLADATGREVAAGSPDGRRRRKR